MGAAAHRVAGRTPDVPERERQREGHVQIEIHAGMIAAQEGPEADGIEGHRITEDCAVGILAEKTEDADDAGHEHRGPGEDYVGPTPA